MDKMKTENPTENNSSFRTEPRLIAVKTLKQNKSVIKQGMVPQARVQIYWQRKRLYSFKTICICVHIRSNQQKPKISIFVDLSGLQSYNHNSQQLSIFEKNSSQYIARFCKFLLSHVVFRYTGPISDFRTSRNVNYYLNQFCYRYLQHQETK